MSILGKAIKGFGMLGKNKKVIGAAAAGATIGALTANQVRNTQESGEWGEINDERKRYINKYKRTQSRAKQRSTPFAKKHKKK